MKLTVIVGCVRSILVLVAGARHAVVGQFQLLGLPLANTEGAQRIVSVLYEMVKVHQTTRVVLRANRNDL